MINALNRYTKNYRFVYVLIISEYFLFDYSVAPRASKALNPPLRSCTASTVKYLVFSCVFLGIIKIM